MRTKLVVVIAVLTLVTFFVGVNAFASPIVNTGDTIYLTESYGNNLGGGAFALADIKSGATFITFCVETTVEFTPGNPYTVLSINQYINPSDNGTPTKLPIGVAYLYSQFRSGTLGGYTNGDPNSANALQAAIWTLLGGNSLQYLVNNNYDFTNSNTLYHEFLNEATPATGWVDNVAVLNLVIPGTLTPAQDQLTLVPEPSTLLLIGVGLAGLGLFRRRRNS